MQRHATSATRHSLRIPHPAFRVAAVAAFAATTMTWMSQGEPIRRYVAPTASGAGDGTSWGDASSNIATAYAEVGANPQGGEVWMKEGAYLLNADPGIELLPNVRLIGGFAGGETDASQSDPEAHVTLIHGANGTYYWCTNSTANSTGVAIVQNGRVNMPPIERCAPEAFLYSSSNGGYNYGFIKSTGCATNSSIENVTLAHFGRYAVNVTTSHADGFTLRKCLVIACGYAQGNNAPAVLIANSHTAIDDCDFVGNRQALRFESSSRTTTNVVLRSRFLYNRHCDYSKTASATGIGSAGRACLVVDSCLFERNTASLSYYGPASSIKVDSTVATSLIVSNTVFRGNQGRLACCGGDNLSLNGGVATFDDCVFIGNTNIVSGGNGYAACVGVNGDSDIFFRNTYFGRNFMDAGAGGGNCGSVFAAGQTFNRDTIFINCTAEGNYARSKAAGTGTIGEYRCSNYLVINSVFSENDAFCGEARQPEIIRTTAWNNNNRMAIVNSIFVHSAADYTPLAFNGLYFLANSYLQGLDLSSAKTSGTGFLGGILTDLVSDPGLRPDYVLTAGGTPVRGLAKDSPLRGKARGVWLGNDGFPYCQDDSGNWRKLKNPGSGLAAYPTLTAAEASALGLDAAAPVIPDATGRARFHRPSPGPLDFSEGHTVIYLR